MSGSGDKPTVFSSAVLSGRRALITGAGGGVGSACALLLAGAGASVALVDMREGSAEATAEKIRALGGTAVAYRVDVSDEKAMHAVVESAASALKTDWIQRSLVQQSHCGAP